MPMPSVPNPHTSTTRLLPTSSARTASAALSSSSTTHSLPVACPKIDWSRSVPSRVAPYLSAAAYGRSSPAAAGCIITDDDDYDDSNEGANVRVVNGELVPGAHEHADDNDVGLGDHVETSPFAHAAAMTQPRQQQMHTPFADAKQRMRTYKNELDDGFRVMDAATTADTADDAELLFDLELQNLRKTDVSVLSKQLSSRGVGNGGNGHHVASMHAAILSARSLPATAVGATSRAYASTVGATAVPIGSNTRPPRSTATTATDHTFTDIHLHPTTIQSARHPAATAAQVQTVVQQYKRAFHPMLCFLARSMRTVRERVGVLQYRTDVLVVGDGPVHGNTYVWQV